MADWCMCVYVNMFDVLVNMFCVLRAGHTVFEKQTKNFCASDCLTCSQMER